MAAAATMFAACSQNEVLNEVQVQDEAQAIGFSTYANKATRSENNNKAYAWDLEDHHESFDVWAGKLVKGAHHAVYAIDSKGTVNYESNSWVATPSKYWDKTATEYYFYAGAPSDTKWSLGLTTAGDYSTGYLKYDAFTLEGINIADGTSTRYDSWERKNDKDLMIAAPKTVERNAYNSTTPADVELQFIHILSRLNILVKKGSNIAGELVVTGLDVHNLKNEGSFDESKEPAGDYKTERWDGTQTGDYTLVGVQPQNALDKTTAVYTHQCLVIPQTIAKQDIDTDGHDIVANSEPYFVIRYTIEGEPYFAYYNLAAAFGVDQLGFFEGWENTLTITINPSTIVFDAKVSEWGEYVKREHVVD